MWTEIFILLSSLLQADISHGQRLEECVDGVVDVVENSPRLTLTCITTNSVTWRFQPPGGISLITIGACDSGASSCSVTGLPGFSLTRLNNSATRLHSNLTTRQDGGRYTYRCDLSSAASHACQADVVVRAVLSAVSVTLTPAGSSWTVQGSVDVTTVYSSLGRYSCQWFQKYETGQEISVWKGSPSLSPGPSDTSNTQNRAGSCSFSMALPGNTGTYTYRVLISPGDSQVQKTIEIDPPYTVSVTCSPSPYVLENTDVTCTCNTKSVGQPAGRLMWFRGTDNNPINTGNYGDTNLTMTPHTMTRAQGDVQFRCDVDWATRVTGQPHTAMISYGPEDIALRLNTELAYLTVQENETVVFNCQGKGRPSLIMVLQKHFEQTEVSKNQSSPLYHTISRTQCEDAGVYVCVAHNGIGSEKRDTGILQVYCKPRGDLSQLSALNIDAQTVTRTFHVVAYPAPDRFGFTFLGPHATSGGPGQELKDVQLNAACVSTPGVLYNSTCTLTVSNVSSPSAAGFYNIRMANTEGHHDFTFQLTTYGASPNTADRTAANFGIIVFLGVALFAALVTCGVLLVCLWRRGRKFPCAGMSRSTASDVGARNSTSFGECSSTVEGTQGAQSGPYDDLKMQDVGLRSPYAEISPSQADGEEAANDQSFSARSEPYDSLKMQDVGLRSPYEEMSHGSRQEGSRHMGRSAKQEIYQN